MLQKVDGMTYKPILIASLILIALNGCAGFGQVTSTITLTDGKTYTVVSKSDALVEFEQDGKKLKVDNRGRPSLIEKIISLLFLTLPDVVIGAK